jgi:RNA polymerase sigma factor (sigma-70 family)
MEYKEKYEKYARYAETLAFKWSSGDINLQEDLYQEGLIALMNDEYDENKADEETYFKMVIRFALKKYLTNYSRLIRIPAHRQNNQEENFKIPTISINTSITEFATISDTLSNIEEDNQLTEDVKLAIRGAINQLKPKWQYIVSSYFGFDENKSAMSFQEIADELGVSKQAVNEQYHKAIDKIREKIKGQ